MGLLGAGDGQRLSSAALARGIKPTEAGQARTAELIDKGILPAEFYTPYIHTIGVAANYFDAAGLQKK